ncbi:MAG: CAP domain-containing protein, partial [Opitutaceae bacterium]
MRRDRLRLCLVLLAPCLTFAQPVALSVNTASREEVRQFYRSVYSASEGVPMQWSGNYATGSAGDTSAAHKEATRLRINFYRALVGVPADITFNATYSAKSQQAALLMSVNDALNHGPPATWIGYNAVAAEAAANSNLALGHAGPDAINGYIADAGGNNAVVGHRRWLFYPQTLQMGTGDVPGIPVTALPRPANAVWIFDGQFGAARPMTRTPAVPYPPAGFVPHSLVWPRWSFSHPEADFTSSTVAMMRNGQIVPVRLEPLGNNVGEPTLVWVYDHLNPDDATAHSRPARDTSYAVNVNSVRIGGALRDFVYDVTVFDPDVPGPDTVSTRILG